MRKASRVRMCRLLDHYNVAEHLVFVAFGRDDTDTRIFRHFENGETIHDDVIRFFLLLRITGYLIAGIAASTARAFSVYSASVCR
ncbi:hypothetical protein JKG47_03020 [Acidithiobacillus sp. MC6.1]|nr:hypothetical protein [Acidithiobacillus sp. MC6.1]